MNIFSFTERLRQNSNGLLHLIKPLTAQQLVYKKGEEWSILQVLEHIYLTDTLVISLLSKPSEVSHHSDEIMGAGKMEHLVVKKRHIKVQAPEILRPSGIFVDAESFETRFLAQREWLTDSLADNSLVPDNRVIKHPFLGDLTAKDWLWFMIFHTERHMCQIGEMIERPEES